MTTFPCPKCDGQGAVTSSTIHPAGGTQIHWECQKCLTTFATRHYLLPEHTVVGEKYRPGVIQGGAFMDTRGKTGS